MPKPTFWNLPEAKRESLIAIAIDEFAAHDYASASISRIVARAGIAKGSLYQYFEDKRDLFLFLVESAAREQLALLESPGAESADADFFARLRRQMRASAEVALRSPRLTQLLLRAYTSAVPFRDELYARLQRTATSHLRPMIEEGMRAGAIDPALDMELVTRAIDALSGIAGPLLLARHGLDPQRARLEDIARLDSATTERVYDDLLRIIERGLRPAAPESVTHAGHESRGAES